MNNTIWYFSKVHLALSARPLYNAVKVVDGRTIEAPFEATTSETEARRRVRQLNHEALMAAQLARVRT